MHHVLQHYAKHIYSSYAAVINISGPYEIAIIQKPKSWVQINYI